MIYALRQENKEQFQEQFIKATISSGIAGSRGEVSLVLMAYHSSGEPSQKFCKPLEEEEFFFFLNIYFFLN